MTTNLRQMAKPKKSEYGITAMIAVSVPLVSRHRAAAAASQQSGGGRLVPAGSSQRAQIAPDSRGSRILLTRPRALLWCNCTKLVRKWVRPGFSHRPQTWILF